MSLLPALHPSTIPAIQEVVRPALLPHLKIRVTSNEVAVLCGSRKFLFTGALYSQLARAIDGDRDLAEITAELATLFPVDVVQVAIRNWLTLGLVVDADSVKSEIASFWASIGVHPDYARSKLERLTIRIDGPGPARQRLLAEFQRLGAGLEPEATSTFGILLVDDYLDSKDTSSLSHSCAQWTIIKVTRGELWVGPLIGPQSDCCLSCLRDQLLLNREFEATWGGRFESQASSNLPFHSALFEIAALEVAKAIVAESSSPLRHHIMRFDLGGFRTERHFVRSQPSCPTCDQGPDTIEFSRTFGRGHDDRSPTCFTSGGRRVVPPDVTIRRLEKYISPITGVISAVQKIEVPDVPWLHTYYASHNFSHGLSNSDELRFSTFHKSSGKGSTDEQARASAICEAIERFSGVFRNDETRVTGSYSSFGSSRALHPNEVMLFSEHQIANRETVGASGNDGGAVPIAFDPDGCIEWTPLLSAVTGQQVYLPTGLLYYFYRGPGAEQFVTTSNGAATGNTLDEATVQGFLELVERDCMALWWYNRIRRAQVPIDSFADPYLDQMLVAYKAINRDIWLLDITFDLGIPTYVAISARTDKEAQDIEIGAGTHFEPRIAALRAITELNQHLPPVIFANKAGEGYETKDTARLSWWRNAKLHDHPYLLPNATTSAAPSAVGAHQNLLDLCIEVARSRALDVLILDQTRIRDGVAVSKVIVPGLRHLTRRFASGRLFDIPVKLGHLPRELTEAELNPHSPLF